VERRKGARRPGASALSKVRFHDEVKVKTIKARGKGLPLSTMRLLDDEDDEDDDSFEIESEDEGDDDDDDNEWDSTQRHPVKKNLEAALSGVDKRSQLDGDESSEGEFTFSEGHHTIKRLQDDLFADEDEPDDGMFSYLMSSTQQTYVWLEVCPQMRSVFPPFNKKLQPWRPKMLPRKTGL
jgi:U3 small nucleolar RNA-associated protein MPP10